MAKSSQMPDGGYNPQLGSNYMMDGFDFDSEYGEGVESARKIPDPDLPRSSRGLTGLPDGFVGTSPEDPIDFRILEGGDERGVGDLSGMVHEAAYLSDLAWLEGATQDPERLPESVNQIAYTLDDLYHQTLLEDAPESGTKPELEQAWGVNRRTDGQNLVPNVEYPRPIPSPTSAIPGDQFPDMVRYAMRKSACGADPTFTHEELASFLGNGLSRIKESPKFANLTASLKVIRAEHGLAGNVYVRDSAFPGILTGKWDSIIKKKCASARYFLTTKGSKLSAYENYLGKKVVTSIPWSEALDHYRPILEARGKKLASGSPREVLRAAFLQRTAKVRPETNFPTHETPTVSTKEAREAFAKAPVPTREVLARNARVALTKRADARIERWVRAGLITSEKANQMRARISDPQELLRTVASEISASRKAKYEGSGVEAKLHEASSNRGAAWAEAKNEELHRAAMDKAHKLIGSLVKSGGLTPEDAKKLLASDLSPQEMVRLANDRAAAPKHVEPVKTAAKTYSGTVFKENTPKKKASEQNPLEVRKLLRWASVQMSEGAAGKELDILLSARFSGEILRQASEPLVQLRKKHEGLAGHLYVDASAYASPSGMEGCEKGALRHRANAIRAVLAMDRCASCVANIEGTCQKYNKSIVTAAPVEKPEKYQAETIRLANSDDAERTASLFAPIYDETEYELQNDVLDDIEYDHSPPVEDLGEILFGGLTLDSDEG